MKQNLFKSDQSLGRSEVVDSYEMAEKEWSFLFLTWFRDHEQHLVRQSNEILWPTRRGGALIRYEVSEVFKNQ